MNKKIAITVGVIVLVVVVGGIYTSMNSNKDAMVAKDNMEQQAKVTEEKSMVKDDAPNTESAMKKDEATMTNTKDSMMQAGSYEAYSPEKVTTSANRDIILFFRASWCPTCRTADQDIKANLGKIPANVTILDVNYDTATALKQKYGVTYQHTFVQVDNNGNLIKKWSGSPTLNAILTEVK